MGGLESSKLHVVHVPLPLSMPSLESAYMYDTTGTSITLKMYPSYPARVIPLVTYFFTFFQHPELVSVSILCQQDV